MATLLIQFADGTRAEQPLERSQPVSVGRHATSDVRIDEDEVGVLHCRVSWNRDHWEVTAASTEGVEVNGTVVRHARLSDHDVIRIGSVDLTLQSADETGGQQAQHQSRSTPGPGRSSLRDSGSRSQQAGRSSSRPAKRSSSHAEQEKPKEQGSSARRRPDRQSDFFTDNLPAEDEGESQLSRELFHSDEDLEILSASELVVDRPETVHQPTPRQEDFGSSDDDQEFASDSEFAVAEDTDDSSEKSDDSDARDQPRPSLLKQARAARGGRKLRPAERDALRSPLVLGLGGGAALLLLGAATLWFTIGRQSTSEQFSLAMDHLNSRRYAQAISAFEKFLQENPGNRLAAEARTGLGRARIEQPMAGAAPDWVVALEQLEQFIRAQRDLSSFAALQPQLAEYARRITAGAARDAGKRASRELLETSSTAERLALQYNDEDTPAERLISAMDDLRNTSLKEIQRHEGREATIAEMRQAIELRQPMTALAARRALLQRWPDLATHREVARLLAQTLQTEQQLVQRTEPRQSAITAAEAQRLPVAVLARHTRARSDETGDGSTVFLTTDSACLGIDLITGTPRWRRTLGDTTAFFPLPVTTSVESLLLYDAGARELQLVHQSNGIPQWRLPLQDRPRGAPLIHEGQIYLAVQTGQLLQIDLLTGTLSAQLAFSQPVVGPPALLADGGHLLLPGEREVLYLLNHRPLEIQQVLYFGHQAGSIEAPPLTMGGLVLLAENDRAGSSRLHVLRASPLDEIASSPPAFVRVEGHVYDRPVLRGRQLFVPSSGERITAFTVTDDPAEQPLTPLAVYEPQAGRTDALHLIAGSDDQVWMAGSMLRHLRIESERIATEHTTGGEGTASQPLQQSSGRLFHARRPSASQAVLFSRTDAETLAGRWRVVAGARPLLLQAARAGTTGEREVAMVIDGMGNVYRLDPAQPPVPPSTDAVTSAWPVGFVTQPVTSIPLENPPRKPLIVAALPDGRAAIAASPPDAALWFLSRTGRIERSIELPAPLQSAPVPLLAGLVLPLPGRLQTIAAEGAPAVEDYLTSTPEAGNQDAAEAPEEEPPAWRQLLRTANNELLTIDSRQHVERLQYRNQPSPHLARITSTPIADRFDVPAAAGEGLLFVATTGGNLLIFDTATLELRQTVPLPGSPRGPVWLAGGFALVEIDGDRLCACVAPVGGQADRQSEPVWTISLPPGGLAGPPAILNDELWLALREGQILVTDRATGKPAHTIHTGEPLAGGPQHIQGHWLVAGADGIVIYLDSATAKPQDNAAAAPPAQPGDQP